MSRANFNRHDMIMNVIESSEIKRDGGRGLEEQVTYLI